MARKKEISKDKILDTAYKMDDGDRFLEGIDIVLSVLD